MKLLATTMMTAALIAQATPAPNDQRIDVSSMTCQQFQNDDARISLILTWFLGFYAKPEDPQVIDLNSIGNARDQFFTFCKQEPTFRMTTAAEGLLGK
jgi:hypothetical protein